MTDDLDPPIDPGVTHRARTHSRRRRLAIAAVVLASSAAVGAVAGIALRDDRDDLPSVDDPPDPTVTVTPPTVPSTTSTTGGVTSTTVAPPPGTLKPPDSATPAAGTCGRSDQRVVDATMNADIPSPRCVQVRPDQVLQLRNNLTAPITVSFGDFDAVIQPGQAHQFDTPFGDYLQPGVHRPQITHSLPGANTTGPEIFLVE